MILNKITIEDILERYDSLPDELLDIIEDPNVEDIIFSICKKNNIIKPEWIDIIKQLTTFVLMGFIHYYDLENEINLALNFDNPKLGNDIAEEISLKIFEPIKSLLEKNYFPLKENVLGPDFFDQILEELKKIKSAEKANILNPESNQKLNTIIDYQVSIPKPQQQPEEKSALISLKELNQTNHPAKNINIKEIKVEAISPNHNLEKNKEFSDLFKATQQTNQTINIKSPEKKLDNLIQNNNKPSPKFIFQHEPEQIPIKTTGIENKIPSINISKISAPPPPPTKVNIEIGKKLETDNKLKKDIKVVNYSNFETNNQYKENLMPPPPPPPPPSQ